MSPSSPTSTPPSRKIFGIGLPRTGTLSVHTALQELGFRSVHNPLDEHTINQLQLGDFNLLILQDHQAFFDLPISAFWHQYYTLFPTSLFILTTRSKDSWLASCEKFWNQKLKLTTLESIREFPYATKYLQSVMFGCIKFNRNRFSDVYDWHHEQIVKVFSVSHNLLIIDLADFYSESIWKRLTDFLNVPPVVFDTAFPHLNKSET